MGVGPIWVRLPTLSLQFWTRDVLRCNGEDLGIYLDHDRSYIETGNISMARILVHLDTREGLVKSYVLKYRNISKSQILDYVGVPFKCRRCHEVGHLYKHCPLILATNAAQPKTLVHAGTQTTEVFGMATTQHK